MRFISHPNSLRPIVVTHEPVVNYYEFVSCDALQRPYFIVNLTSNTIDIHTVMEYIRLAVNHIIGDDYEMVIYTMKDNICHIILHRIYHMNGNEANDLYEQVISLLDDKIAYLLLDSTPQARKYNRYVQLFSVDMVITDVSNCNPISMKHPQGSNYGNYIPSLSILPTIYSMFR